MLSIVKVHFDRHNASLHARETSVSDLALCLLLYLPAAFLIDCAAAPRGRARDRPLWALLAGAACALLLFAAWFSISWRPLFATMAAVATMATVTLISNVKHGSMREPLTFIDFVLVPQIWRHPQLYFVEFLRRPLFHAAAAAGLAFVAAWWHLIEPSMLPDAAPFASAAGLAILVAGTIAWLLAGPVPAAASEALARRLHPLDAARDVAEFGLVATLLGGLLAWRHRNAPARQRTEAWPSVQPSPRGAPVVVVVQSESFVDLQAAGLAGVDLPCLRRVCRRAVRHGRLSVQAQGAGTLRSEFAFLSGRPIQSLGFGALHPYFHPDGRTRTVAHVLRDAGFHTIFLHPFDLGFFGRDCALPRLGFDRLIGEHAFAGMARNGYYVSDDAVADQIVRLAAQHTGPLFLMAVTMENHHPWRAGRLAGIDAPAEQYLHHLGNADRMLGRLALALEGLGRPAVLTFYGDHVPILDEIAARLPDTRTDYLVASFGSEVPTQGVRRDCAVDELAHATLEALAQAIGRPATPIAGTGQARGVPFKAAGTRSAAAARQVDGVAPAMPLAAMKRGA
jgi:hypothetical protein